MSPKHPFSKQLYYSPATVVLSEEQAEFLNRKLAAQRGEVYVPQVKEEGGSAQKEHFTCIDADLSSPSIGHCLDMANRRDFYFEGTCQTECRARRVRDERQKNINWLFA